MAQAVGPAVFNSLDDQQHQCVVGRVRPTRLLRLLDREGMSVGLPLEASSSGTGGCALALLCGSLGHLAGQLSETPEHRRHEPAMGRGGVGPGIGQGAEGGALLSDGAQDVQEVPRRARETVQARDQEHIPKLEMVEELLKLRPLLLGPGDRHLKHPLRACRLKLDNLGVEGLAVRRDTGVALGSGYGISLPLRT